MVMLRTNNLLQGHSAVRGEVVKALIDCHNAGIVPFVPERGSVSSSGDLIPLSYVATLVGGKKYAKCTVDDVPTTADKALK
jgi:histidine ammonia-lyase